MASGPMFVPLRVRPTGRGLVFRGRYLEDGLIDVMYPRVLKRGDVVSVSAGTHQPDSLCARKPDTKLAA